MMSLGPFQRNEHPSLGVELELALVDSRTMALRSGYTSLTEALAPDVADRIKPEFLQCYVEVDTPACRDTPEVGRELSRTIRTVDAAARSRGLGLYWGGTHPFSRWRDQAITPDRRYHELAEAYQEVVRRPVTFGLHVHVGVGSGDEAVAAMCRMVDSLPLLLALSSNSPFWQGRATGLHSHRIDVLEGIPTGGLPPRLDRWSDYDAFVGSFTRSGFIRSEKELWWDVRPNPRLGTVEVRICDMPADLDTAVALVALIQCLVAESPRARPDPGEAGEARSLAARQNRWFASRHGMDARFIDLATGSATPARDLARRQVDRLMATAEPLGCAADLARIATLADGPSGAQRQLADHAETGCLVEVVRRSVEASRIVPAGGAPRVTRGPAGPAATMPIASMPRSCYSAVPNPGAVR